MSDECTVRQSLGRNSIPYADNCTILFYKAVLIGKRLFFHNDFIDKVGILFPVCRMHHLRIKVCPIIQQCIWSNAEHFTQVAAHIVQVNRGCQNILVKAADLMIKYFLHIVWCVVHSVSPFAEFLPLSMGLYINPHYSIARNCDDFNRFNDKGQPITTNANAGFFRAKC